MIDRLPEGKSIGWMQAPPNWIFTHTVRFIGIVRVVIQDGEGFILINKGKPLTYYFKHGRIELKGHSALDYFNSHPTIEFNLCKYTPDEFAEALKICNVDEQIPAAVAPAEQKVPVVSEPVELYEAEPVRVEPVIPEPVKPEPARVEFNIPEPVKPVPVIQPIVSPVRAPVPPPAEEEGRVQEPPSPEIPVIEKPPEKPAVRLSARPVPPAPPVFTRTAAETVAPPAVPSPQVLLDENAIKIIGQIKKLNGIVAISVFNDERNIILMGDVEIEPLLKIARNMLETTRKISPNLQWGSFVHMTLQIPEGNVIIAPYLEYHLCLLTTRTINIGHIRRILRDLQTTGGQ
jgi:hypothetical protein